MGRRRWWAVEGDPTGWPALVAALESSSEHSRLMAVRHLMVFLAFDGKVVDGDMIDVRARYVDALADPSAYVAVEAPGLVAESGLAGAVELQRAAQGSAATDEARRAASDVLAVLDEP